MHWSIVSGCGQQRVILKQTPIPLSTMGRLPFIYLVLIKDILVVTADPLA